MDKDWIPVITALIIVFGTLSGVVIGGGISSFIKWFEINNQKDLETKKLKLTKLEELYQLLSVHSSNIINTLEQADRDRKENEYENIVDRFISFSTEKLDMNIEFYIPKLIPNLKKLINLEKELVNEFYIYKIAQKQELEDIKKSFEKVKKSTSRLSNRNVKRRNANSLSKNVNKKPEINKKTETTFSNKL